MRVLKGFRIFFLSWAVANSRGNKKALHADILIEIRFCVLSTLLLFQHQSHSVSGGKATVLRKRSCRGSAVFPLTLIIFSNHVKGSAAGQFFLSTHAKRVQA